MPRSWCRQTACQELYPLQEGLSRWFGTVAVDWPGFGQLPRPRVDWRPELCTAFLDYLLTRVVPRPFAVIAAGHGAGYLAGYGASRSSAAERLILLSPTWRGPLPTMMNGWRPAFGRIARVIDRPVLGSLLYAFNVNRFVVGMMARGHVYADRRWLTGPRMVQKLAVTRAPGARHGSARFVTGCLDPFPSRAQFLEAVQRIDVPVLNVFAEGAPRKSREEMEALTALPHVQTVRLRQGKLSFYEKFPDDTLGALTPFLGI
jgi:pimeloyl-ACP methyl ester carboxylesterase